MRKTGLCFLLLPFGLAVTQAQTPQFKTGGTGPFTIEQVMDYAFPTSLVPAAGGEHIAWTADLRGVRNVFVADGPNFTPHQVTHYTDDDGQEIDSVRITPDGKTVVYSRGSEHNSLGDTADPDSDVAKPDQQVWAVHDGGAPKLLGTMGCANEDCEDIEMSPDGQWVAWTGRDLAWTTRNTVYLAPVSGAEPAHPVAWSQGNNGSPRWSPDSKSLAFVSVRPGHALIAVYTMGAKYLRYMQPSVDRDSLPRWSPDGRNIVFVRVRGITRDVAPPDNPYLPPLGEHVEPSQPPQLARWELWVADAASGQAHRFWESGTEPQDGMYNTTQGEALNVGADHTVLFSSEATGWNHLYSVSFDTSGDQPNQAKLLTPGDFEIENVSLSPDGRTAVFSSNQGDLDSRHLWRVPLDGSAAPTQITRGAAAEWSPVQTADGRFVLCLGSTATTPAMPYLVTEAGRKMIGELQPDFPANELVVPKVVIFPSTDNFQIHAELFVPKNVSGQAPAVIFVHGGSQRQMLPDFHYMDYYHNAYAENQFLVSRGFIVLSINYRTGIMYGRAFRTPAHAGRAGGSEYNDVVAAAKYLQSLEQVDPHRLGIWGGSYGGYLTAMALSRNSDLFAAGVDFHGVHDWSTDYSGGGPGPNGAAGGRGGGAGRGAAPAPGAPGQPGNLAFDSSPDAFVSQWKSPVLLIQGDDDRNVNFGQMIDMVDRLRGQRVPFEQMVIPDEIHGFLRWISWVRAYAATEDFLYRVLQQHDTISTAN